MANYQPPVSQLLTMGDCRKIKTMPDYLKLGFTEADIPELLRMSLDPDLNFALSDAPEVWSPIHAWRTLGQLKADAAIEPLLTLFHELEDSDWTEELHDVFASIGAAALPALKAYLADPAHGLYPRADVVEVLPHMLEKHPETRAEGLAILTGQLEKFEENEVELNAFIIWALADSFKAVEAAPLMEKVYAAGRVDKMIVGNWYSVQVTLGLQPPNAALEHDPELRGAFEQKFPGLSELRKLIERHPDFPQVAMDSLFSEDDPAPAQNKPNRSHQKAKTKHKRKIAKASQRKNRRK